MLSFVGLVCRPTQEVQDSLDGDHPYEKSEYNEQAQQDVLPPTQQVGDRTSGDPQRNLDGSKPELW